PEVVEADAVPAPAVVERVVIVAAVTPSHVPAVAVGARTFTRHRGVGHRTIAARTAPVGNLARAVGVVRVALAGAAAARVAAAARRRGAAGDGVVAAARRARARA